VSHFVKLYATILDSTIWAEPAPTVKVWLTMLAMADPNGFVEGAITGVMRRAIVSREECETAIRVLESPDPDSKTPDHEGRRIERVEGGWQILNHRKYRDLRTETQIAVAARVRKHRGETAGNGYVYYAQDGARVKIGFSKNPHARVGELKCAIPGLKLIATEEGTLDLEHHRHKQFAEGKLSREWFTLSPKLKEHIALISGVTVTDVTKSTRSNRKKRDVRPEVEVEVEVEVEATKATTPTSWEANGQRPLSWPDEGAQLWSEKVSPIEPGRFGKAVKKVVTAYGWPLTRQALECYIELKDGRPRKAEWFADDAVTWVRLSKMPTVDPVTRELTEKGRLAYNG
jgi:hypothetical protein